MEPKVLLEMLGQCGLFGLRVVQCSGNSSSGERRPWVERCNDAGGWEELHDAPESVAHALLKLAGERDAAFRTVDTVRGDAVRLERERAAAREEIARLAREVEGAEQGRDRWRRLYDGLTSEWAKKKAELDARFEEVARGSMTIDDVADALEEAGIKATVDLVPRGRYLEIWFHGDTEPRREPLEDHWLWTFDAGSLTVTCGAGDKIGASGVRWVKEISGKE